MIKKIIKILLIIICIFIVFKSYQAFSAGQVSFTILPGSGYPGTGLNEVVINVINSVPINSIGFNLKDSPDVLTVTQIQISSASGKYTGFFNNSVEKGTIQVTIPDSNVAAAGSSYQIKLLYDISQTASAGKVNLSFSDVKVRDNNNETIEATYSNGSFKIINYGSNTANSVNFGDVYPASSCGNGIVDIFDVLEVIDFSLGRTQPTACQKQKADVFTGNSSNCTKPNGVVDVFDVIAISDYSIGKPNCFNEQSNVLKTPLNIKVKQVSGGSYIIWAWDKVEEAEKYTIQKYAGINCDENKKIGDIIYFNSSNPEWKQIVSSNKDDNYSIRIQSQKGTQKSQWSRCVNSIPPPPWYAESAQANSGVLLVWGGVPEIASAWGYKLDVYEGAGCSNKYLTGISTSAGLTSYHYTGPGKVISYYVRACYDAWSCSMPTACWTTVLK